VDTIFIFLLVIFTSSIAYHANKRKPSEETTTMRAAVGAFFEWVGTLFLFFAANLGVGVVVVLLMRAVTGQFLSLYLFENVYLLLLSVAQAFVFHYLWKR
jgi:hypothetical protein